MHTWSCCRYGPVSVRLLELSGESVVYLPQVFCAMAMHLLSKQIYLAEEAHTAQPSTKPLGQTRMYCLLIAVYECVVSMIPCNALKAFTEDQTRSCSAPTRHVYKSTSLEAPARRVTNNCCKWQQPGGLCKVHPNPTLILNDGPVPALGAAEKSAAQAFLCAPAGCHICSANTTLHVTGHFSQAAAGGIKSRNTVFIDIYCADYGLHELVFCMRTHQIEG